MLWLTLIGVTMMTTIVSCKVNSKHETQQEDNQDNSAWESASFFPYYIISIEKAENSQNEICYWLIYDDIDAGFDNEIVSMDEQTYDIIKHMWSISKKCDKYCVNQYNAELLQMMEDYEPIIYNNEGTAILLLSDKD